MINHPLTILQRISAVAKLGLIHPNPLVQVLEGTCQVQRSQPVLIPYQIREESVSSCSSSLSPPTLNFACFSRNSRPWTSTAAAAALAAIKVPLSLCQRQSPRIKRHLFNKVQSGESPLERPHLTESPGVPNHRQTVNVATNEAKLERNKCVQSSNWGRCGPRRCGKRVPWCLVPCWFPSWPQLTSAGFISILTQPLKWRTCVASDLHW